MRCPGIEMTEIQKEKDIHVRSVCPFLMVRLAAHVSNGLKSRVRPVVGRI